MVREKSHSEILDITSIKRYVNLYFRDTGIDAGEVRLLVKKISLEAESQSVVEVDIEAIPDESKIEEAKALAQLIRQNVDGVTFNDGDTSSLTSVLLKASKGIAKPALIILYFFEDRYSEKEKDWLRSLRQFFGYNDSPLLRILIVSRNPIREWELFLESNLDDRHISFYEYAAAFDEGGKELIH